MSAVLAPREPAVADTSALSGPFAVPPDPHALRPTGETRRLVRTQVRGLLEATPAYHQLGTDDQAALEDRINHVAAYAAECLRDIYWQSERLGQTPVLKETRTTGARLTPATASAQEAPAAPPSRPALSAAQANDFSPRAASQIGNITQQTLRAIAFPTFVADLIRGTFDAILQTNIQQMDAFNRMLGNVSKTVDQFMADNISDEQAHGWLAQTYPRHLTLSGGKAVPRDGADSQPPPDFERELHVSASLDEASIEETLLPAARRRLAETRLQMLSTMVLMGINRIVITAGKIRATMGFHIDTSDSAFERNAEDLDARVAMRGHYNALVWGVEASASLAYVTSRRAGSDAEINVETDLTGEVELHFKSDYFPVERFAPSGTLRAISANTAVPEANPPPTLTPPRAGPPTGGDGAAFHSPRTQRRTREAAPTMTPVGSPLPEARLPTAPIERGRLDPGANRPVPEAPSGDGHAEARDGAARERPAERTEGAGGGSGGGARHGTTGTPTGDTPAGHADTPAGDSEGEGEDSGGGPEGHAESAALSLPAQPRPSTRPRPAGELPWTVH